jgi:hypothetical protein
MRKTLASDVNSMIVSKKYLPTICPKIALTPELISI